MWNKISQKWSSSTSAPTSPVSRPIETNPVSVTEVPVKKTTTEVVDYDDQLAQVFLQRKRDLLEAMRDVRKGVEIKDRTYRLKTYPDCFVASDFVSWLLKNFSSVIQTRGVAIRLGEALQREGIIGHVTRQYLFKDENIFFRFVESDMGALNEIISNNSDFISFMKGPSGIPVTHRRKGLKLYKNCFTGDDMVTWLVVNLFAETRVKALHIGNALLNKRVFDHVTQKHYLEDSVDLLYQYLEEDEPSPSSPRKPEVTTEILRPKDSLADSLGTEAESLMHYIFGFLNVNDFTVICRVSKRYRKQAYRYSTNLSTWYFNRRAFGIYPNLSHKDRVVMWHGIVSNYDEYADKNRTELKDVILVGVPPALRGRLWLLMMGAKEMMKKNSGIYEFLLTKECTSMNDIERDVPRTLTILTPEHQEKMVRILKAFANFNHEVQYCEGMNYLAGVLILHMTEEEAFWCLVCLMKNYYFDAIYQKGLTGLLILLSIFGSYVDKYIPLVGRTFDQQSLSAHQFANRWFLTLFSCVLPLELVYKIWDLYVWEGWEAITKVGLAILKLSEDFLVSAKVEEIFEHFSNLPADIVDANRLFTSYSSFYINPVVFKPLTENKNM